MLLQILLLIVGFVILIKGADFFVDGASSTATNFKIPKIVIGLTIVAFGTSAPEFAVSLKSIMSGNYDIVLGNVIGSNILNILLILGVSSLFGVLVVKENTVKKELPILLLITTLFGVLVSNSFFNADIANNFTRSDGIILLLFFTVFVYYLVSVCIKDKKRDNEEKAKMTLLKAIIFTVLGIAMIVLGSDLVVNQASSIAKSLNVSEKMISLTIIALGTSLPELVTSVVAAKKGESDLAIGNVVGSNIFNIGLVLGLPVAIFGGINQINFNYIDIIAMLISAILLFVFTLNDRKISKKEGIMFLMVFLMYYTYVIMRG